MEVKFIFPGKNMDPEEKKKKGWENEKDFPPLSGKKKKKRGKTRRNRNVVWRERKNGRERDLDFGNPRFFLFFVYFLRGLMGFLDFGDVVEGREKVMDGCR